MESKLNAELIEKARQAKSPEELLALAKENNYDFNEEQANAYFEQLNKSGELSDNELENVAGGGCSTPQKPKNMVYVNSTCIYWACKKCCGDIDEHRKNNIRHVGISDRFYCCDCKYCQLDTKFGCYCCSNPNGNY